MRKIKKQKGITLIALIITIVVILILAVVTISQVRGENSIIKNAIKSRFLNDVGKYKEELELYKSNWKIEYQLNGNKVTDGINSTKEINADGYKEIQGKYIKSFSRRYEDKLLIKEGELVYIYTGNDEEKAWAEQLGLYIQSEDATIVIEKQGIGTIACELMKDGKIEAKVGQTITLSATAGNIEQGDESAEFTFAGWYNNGTLISSDADYTFKVRGDTTLTVVFETDVTVIYYLENDEEKVMLDSSTTLTGYTENNTITKVEVGRKCTSIGASAFKGCDNLKTVIADTTDTVFLGANAFENCKSIEGINIPSGCTSIGGAVFRGCDNLKTVIADTTDTVFLGANAFENCVNLEQAKFYNVKFVETKQFLGCAKLGYLQLGKEGLGVSQISSTQSLYGCINNKLIVDVYLSDTSKRMDTMYTNATINYYDEAKNLIETVVCGK